MVIEADGSELWTWLEFINAESEEELKMLVKREPKMRAPVEKLLAVNRDPATRALYEAREKERRDNRARERYAMQQGIQQGMQQGKVETARNLKALGVSTDLIIQSTGLSPEEIAKI